MTVFAFMKPETMRVVLLVLVGGGYLCYHLLPLVCRCRAWLARKRTAGGDEKRAKISDEGVAETSGGRAGRHVSVRPPAPPAGVKIGGDGVAETSGGAGVGEELFNRARAMPHRPIPDPGFDGEYLELLGRSAAQGYAPALTKLGEYAMRRAAWIEAYYWMKLARRNGMHGLSPTLRRIRQNWAMAGFDDEVENVSELFPPKAGSLGRALIHLDSGHAAAAARKFLKARHPEFL